MPEPQNGYLVRCQSLNDVVNGDIRRPTDQDSLVPLGELEDELYESMCFASLTTLANPS